MIKEYLIWLDDNNKSENTIYNYMLALREYFEWFNGNYSKLPKILYVQNIREYIQYLKTVKSVSAKTVNSKLYALQSFNEYLVFRRIQKDIVINKSLRIKVQNSFTSPAKFEKNEVNTFIQTILENNNNRNYALVILLAYTGIRISEALNIRIKLDLFVESKELVIREGKGDKQRTVLLNNKVIVAINEYLEIRKTHKYKDSSFLFVSNKSCKLSRMTVNNMFFKYSKMAGLENNLSPHDLRHFFCSNALESGFDVHEVAYIAGHSNIHTTLLYANPSRQKIIDKLNNL